ncbi:hypothetical protein MMC10_006459 [Thelotrema lepadinum]|nr:hypothetical protein [Thelotrema lepadinum]
MAQPSISTLDETLNRISSKPGVRSALYLSKTDGAIIRSTGLALESQTSSADGTQDGYRDEQEKKQKTAEEVAKMVFSFINAAGSVANGLDESDDVQLLRLRTKKTELVIVPGAILTL